MGIGEHDKVCNAQICRAVMREKFAVGGQAQSVLRDRHNSGRKPNMRILQPAEWSKPRGFSHGVELDSPGRWIVLAGQTGGDEKGDYPPALAAQVAAALKRIVKLLAEAGAGPEHIVRLTWYLTSRGEYEAAGSRHRGGMEGDVRPKLSALDTALHRRARRREGQGRDRSDRLRPRIVRQLLRMVPRIPPAQPPDGRAQIAILPRWRPARLIDKTARVILNSVRMPNSPKRRDRTLGG